MSMRRAIDGLSPEEIRNLPKDKLNLPVSYEDFVAAIKKINLLIEKKDKKGALSYLPKLNSELMKIAKTGVIKKQNASRNVSRITKRINSL